MITSMDLQGCIYTKAAGREGEGAFAASVF